MLSDSSWQDGRKVECSGRMREKIGGRFVERSFSLGPYLLEGVGGDALGGLEGPSDDGLQCGEDRLLRSTSRFTCKLEENEEPTSRFEPLS
jgi:hypothetical protein